MTKKYEVILFDADGTLFDFERAEEYALEKTMLAFGMEYQHDLHLRMYREINKAIWAEFERGLITAEALKPERFRRFFNLFQVEVELNALSMHYLDCLAEGAYLFNGAEELLANLQRTYKLGLITNGLARVQHSRFARAGIVEYFDAIIISEEVGATKPHPAIFVYAFSQLGHQDKKSALIVGDSLTADIQGGSNFGIDTCWYNPLKDANTTNTVPTYEVSALGELLQILDECAS